MELEKTAKQLEAMGNRTRLAIIQLLVNAGKDGINVSEINQVIAVPPSTLSHHLAKLVNAGLVSQQRAGRTLICQTEPGSMEELVMYLADKCCGEDSEIWA